MKIRLFHKLFCFFGLVFILAAAIALSLSYRRTVDMVLGDFGESLKLIAEEGARSFDPSDFKEVMKNRDISSEAYSRVRAALIETKQMAGRGTIELRYLYTMAPADAPGIWMYVVDTQPPTLEDGNKNPEFSYPGETEDFSSGDIVMDSFMNRKGAVDDSVKEYPEWGPLLSAAVPVFDRDGSVIGVVGVDAPVSAVSGIKGRIRGIIFPSFAAGLLISLIGSILVSWQMTRPVRELVNGTREVAAGNLDFTVSVNLTDEIGDLARAFNEMVKGLKLRDLYRRQFERYVSRQVADKVLAEPEKQFWLGERRRATILFADIRGFTAMAERLPPEEVVRRLNEYLRVMIDIVFEHEGTLDKFIGDAIMAVFGAPVSLGNDEERAVRAALAMQKAVGQLHMDWSGGGQDIPYRIGIGINTGEVVVGNIGSEHRLEYAAIGDHVNIASRLEGLNRTYGTGILVSSSTYEAVRSLVDARLVDKVAVKGRQGELEVYEIRGLRGETA